VITFVPLLFSFKDVKRPPRASSHLFAAVHELSVWTKQKLGVTFGVGLPQTFTSAFTQDEVITQVLGGAPSGEIGNNIGKFLMSEGRIWTCSPSKFYGIFVFRKSHPTGKPGDIFYGLGGMTGMETFGCNYSRPGAMYMSDHVPWLLAGVSKDKLAERGWDVVPDKRECGIGQISHEFLAHALAAWPDTSDVGCISSSNLYNWPDVGFSPGLREALLESGYLG